MFSVLIKWFPAIGNAIWSVFCQWNSHWISTPAWNILAKKGFTSFSSLYVWFHSLEPKCQCVSIFGRLTDSKIISSLRNHGRFGLRNNFLNQVNRELWNWFCGRSTFNPPFFSAEPVAFLLCGCGGWQRLWLSDCVSRHFLRLCSLCSQGGNDHSFERWYAP